MAKGKLTAEQQALATQLGIDWTKIDWNKVIAILQFILTLLAQPKPVLRAECPDEHCDCCDKCLEAANYALQSAQINLDCVQGFCPGPSC